VELQEKYDALCMDSQKKPPRGDEGEVKKLQLKVRDWKPKGKSKGGSTRNKRRV
jgi:hypothetical protein